MEKEEVLLVGDTSLATDSIKAKLRLATPDGHNPQKFDEKSCKMAKKGPGLRARPLVDLVQFSSDTSHVT